MFPSHHRDARRGFGLGLLLFGLVLWLLAACAPVQTQSSDAAAQSSGAGADAASIAAARATGPLAPIVIDENYRISADDLLEISFFGAPELNRTVRVNSSGEISLPLVGLMQISGLTGTEAETLVGRKYEQSYLQDPQVSVFIKEFTTQRITVDGAVSRPGIYPLSGQMTLLRALAVAGGSGQLADMEHVMLFRVNEQGETTTAQYDVLKIREGEAPDPVLKNDDLVVVNRDKGRVTLRDSKLRDFIDFINPFSSSVYRLDRAGN